MNTQTFTARNLLRAAALAAAFTAMAAPWASHAAGTFMNGQSHYGQPAPATAAAPVVDLGSTRHLNVGYGETVSFRGTGGQVFTWTFNGLDLRAIDLARIAPPAFATPPLRVFIGRNPSMRS